MLEFGAVIANDYGQVIGDPTTPYLSYVSRNFVTEWLNNEALLDL